MEESSIKTIYFEAVFIYKEDNQNTSLTSIETKLNASNSEEILIIPNVSVGFGFENSSGAIYSKEGRKFYTPFYTSNSSTLFLQD